MMTKFEKKLLKQEKALARKERLQKARLARKRAQEREIARDRADKAKRTIKYSK